MELLLVAIGLLLLLGCFWLQKPARNKPGRLVHVASAVVVGLLITLAALLIVAGGSLFWFTHRPLPGNTQETLFEGIAYTRDARRVPRPIAKESPWSNWPNWLLATGETLH